MGNTKRYKQKTGMGLCLLLSLYLVVCIECLAQVPVYVNITRDSGLPDDEVYDVFQASDRSIWIATNFGLCRYNGTHITPYNTPEQRSLSVADILEDAEGRIWVHSFFGQIFYVENGKMHVFDQFPNDSAAGHIQIHFDPIKKVLCIFSDKGVFQYQKPAGSTTAKDYKLIGQNKAQLWAPFIYKNNLWAVAYNTDVNNDRIAKLNGLKVDWLPVEKRAEIIPSNIRGFFTYQDSLYLYQKVTRNIYVLRGNQFKHKVSFPDLPAFNTINIINNKIILATRGGVYRLNSAFELDTKWNLTEGMNIACSMQDTEGNFWLGTIDAGIFMYPNSEITHWNALENIAGTNNVTALKANGNSLFAGFSNGNLGFFDLEEKKLKLLQKPDVITPVTFLYYDSSFDKLLWMASKIHWATTKNGFQRYLKEQSPAIKDVLFISKDSLLVAAGNEASIITKNWNTADRQVITNKRSRAIWFNPEKQHIWVATKDGIEVFNRQGTYIKNLLFEGKNINATDFEPYLSGMLISTFNQGILWADTNLDEIQSLVNYAGLNEHAVLKMAGGTDKLWMLSNTGLMYYDFAQQKAKKVGIRDGLPTIKINAMVSHKGSLWIGVPTGLIQISEKVSINPQQNIPIQLRHIEYNGDTLNNEDRTFKVASKRGTLKIEVEYINYKLQGRFFYRYKLLSNNTQYTTNNAVDNILTFANLPAGNHRLEIEVVDEMGEQLALLNNIQLIVPVAFYQKWWFILLSIVFICMFIYLLIAVTSGRIKKQEKEKLEKAKLQSDLRKSMLASIKAQMNPHFIFNALNTVQGFIYANHKDEANAYLSKFSTLIRTVLQMSNTEKVSLTDEMNALNLYLQLEQIRFANKLSYTLEVDPEISTDQIFIPSMIVQPYVENAIKHGLQHKQANRKLAINFAMQTPHELEITIDDNGIGRIKSAEINAKRQHHNPSLSIETKLTRVQLLNLDASMPIRLNYVDKLNDKGEAAGTIVVLIIPV